MSIELMLQNCKNDIELRAFAQAQGKTLLTLMKKNRELEDEIDHLKKLVVNGALPIINDNNSPIAIGTVEEEIAKRELRKLNERSLDSECLLLEEAKKLEIYAKILSPKLDKKQNQSEREVKEMNVDDLLALVESPVKSE